VDINISLIGQMFTFIILVGVTVRYVWPPIVQAIEARQAEIAAGLEAAKEGLSAKSEAEKARDKMLAEARGDVKALREDAKKEADRVKREAAEAGQAERDRLVALAEEDIQQAKDALRASLKKEMVDLVLMIAQRLLSKKMTAADQKQFIESCLNEDRA
jgi:F-type H+-transporting ATPase subunit b